MVHYLNPFQGQLVVQSIGKGLVQIPPVKTNSSSEEAGREPLNYTIDLIGVSIFDKNEGFMLERVWAIDGATTASAMFNVGTYVNNGRIYVLGDKRSAGLRPDSRCERSEAGFPEPPEVGVDREVGPRSRTGCTGSKHSGPSVGMGVRFIGSGRCRVRDRRSAVFDWENWVQTVWDVLQTDDEACWGLIRAAGGKMSAMVALIDGDTSLLDALAYARTLAELGLSVEAHDIFNEVLRASFGLWQN